MALQRVKQFKDVVIDYEATGGTLGVAVYTDMPGGSMASRKTKDLAITTTRSTAEIPLDGVEGTLFQLKFTPANTAVVRLYGATLRLRAIGVYMDGSLGDVWETQPIGFGIA